MQSFYKSKVGHQGYEVSEVRVLEGLGVCIFSWRNSEENVPDLQ